MGGSLATLADHALRDLPPYALPAAGTGAALTPEVVREMCDWIDAGPPTRPIDA